jgi:hypothetical protein
MESAARAARMADAARQAALAAGPKP